MKTERRMQVMSMTQMLCEYIGDTNSQILKTGEAATVSGRGVQVVSLVEGA